MNETGKHRGVGALLFLIQLLLAATLVLTASFESTCALCWITAGSGAAIAMWAWWVMGLRRLNVLPQPKQDAVLVIEGPYRYIRHPMYTGLLLFCAGLVPTSYEHWKIALWVLLLLTLNVKARVEESLLDERFPEYEQYCRKTRRFVPWIY